MPNPFENITTAIESHGKLDVDNARAVMDWVQHAPQYAETQALLWQKHGNAIVEGLPVTPEFGEALSKLSAAQRRLVSEVAETGATFRRTHAEQLRKIEDPKPNEDKWDISKNRA
jgi:hypothetical protein